MGLSAADNLSPTGRSNIQSVQANEGVGPNGEVEYRYRRNYGAAFVQDDIKVSRGSRQPGPAMGVHRAVAGQNRHDRQRIARAAATDGDSARRRDAGRATRSRRITIRR